LELDREAKMLVTCEGFEFKDRYRPGCTLVRQVLDQSGERCPPLSTYREFANNCNNFLCDICGADILHVRCHFKLLKEKKSTTLVQAMAALWGVRRSAAQPKRDWPWDVCYDCMEALRTGLSKEQKKLLPKTVA
jgi:hypothetical protein